MKNSKLAILKSEILRDTEKFEQLFEKFESSYKQYQQKKEYAYLVESAFHVNRLYTGFERMFGNIAKTFENTIDDKAWHKSLLERMAIGIENIRPAFISETSHKYLNELRAFRHFFRHTYDFDLEEEKFAIVASGARELKKSIKTDIRNFLGFVNRLLND